MVGTLALTVMGAMSEKIALLVDGAARFYNTRVIVQPKASVPGQFLGACPRIRSWRRNTPRNNLLTAIWT